MRATLVVRWRRLFLKLIFISLVFVIALRQVGSPHSLHHEAADVGMFSIISANRRLHILWNYGTAVFFFPSQSGGIANYKVIDCHSTVLESWGRCSEEP